MFETPVAVGLLVCERVEFYPASSRFTIVNRLGSIRADRLPHRPRELAVFAVLTDGYGEVPITVKVDHLDTDTLVSVYHTTLSFPDRLRQLVYHLDKSGTVFEWVGAYQFTLFAGDEPLARTVVKVDIRN